MFTVDSMYLLKILVLSFIFLIVMSSISWMAYFQISLGKLIDFLFYRILPLLLFTFIILTALTGCSGMSVSGSIDGVIPFPSKTSD